MKSTLKQIKLLAIFFLVLIAVSTSLFAFKLKNKINEFSTEYKEDTDKIDSLMSLITAQNAPKMSSGMAFEENTSGQSKKPICRISEAKVTEALVKDTIMNKMLHDLGGACTDSQSKTAVVNVLLTYEKYLKSAEFSALSLLAKN